ncbi:ubiquinone biosynthesis protein COQ9 [Entomortierella parvispora]|uniref:Ubiquinone biosynthesis protein n=1 Tax=Entomortierella parvispora TaxID=205924 RepID=A0A9P3HJT3_9FUNG|nr:ubiquinone biosynthesis protein COQ9 [Entomortierella parvispora]
MSLLQRTLTSTRPAVAALARSSAGPMLARSTPARCLNSSAASLQAEDTQQPKSSESTLRPAGKTTPEAILKNALTFVPEHGWTSTSIAKAAESMGYPAIVHGMFPNGGADLIDYFLQDCLNRLPLELEGRMEGLSTQEKIKLGTLTRLGMIAPYIDRWPEALAVMGQPKNVPMSLNHLAKIVDEIWHLAGDKSADMNWYTKRASLAGVYTTTELYMTTDKTPNYQATQRFLERRFEDAATVGKATSEVIQMAEFGAKSVLGLFASKGFRV